MDSFWDVLSALGAILTAVFMYPTFVATRPVLKAFVGDVPGANRRHSNGEQLQKDGWYRLIVRIKAPKSCAIYPRTLSVRNAKLGEVFNLPDCLEPDQEHLEQVLVRPDAPEEGELVVCLRFGLLRRVRVRCKYKKTAWMA